MGGEIMFVEATKMPGMGELTLTGQLGDVMKESAQIALNWVRSNSPVVSTSYNHHMTRLMIIHDMSYDHHITRLLFIT